MPILFSNSKVCRFLYYDVQFSKKVFFSFNFDFPAAIVSRGYQAYRLTSFFMNKVLCMKLRMCKFLYDF